MKLLKQSLFELAIRTVSRYFKLWRPIKSFTPGWSIKSGFDVEVVWSGEREREGTQSIVSKLGLQLRLRLLRLRLRWLRLLRLLRQPKLAEPFLNWVYSSPNKGGNDGLKLFPPLIAHLDVSLTCLQTLAWSPHCWFSKPIWDGIATQWRFGGLDSNLWRCDYPKLEE